MRSKRVQRHRARQPRPTSLVGYPDLFSRHNPGLVQAEVNREDMCPCCVDRQAEIELRREESAYYDAAEDFVRWQEDEFEARYADFWPSCCGRFCFCTDCCEASEHDGPDYDEWRRAFPALPWEA